MVNSICTPTTRCSPPRFDTPRIDNLHGSRQLRKSWAYVRPNSSPRKGPPPGKLAHILRRHSSRAGSASALAFRRTWISGAGSAASRLHQIAASGTPVSPTHLTRRAPLSRAAESRGMADRIRILPHEAVPLCGSFGVRFPDGGHRGSSIGTTSPVGGSGPIWSMPQPPCARPSPSPAPSRTSSSDVLGVVVPVAAEIA